MPPKSRKSTEVPSETLYRKIGGKYVAVSGTMEFGGWAEGFYLVHIQPSSRSMRAALDPDFAELECAYAVLGEELLRAMHEASKLNLTANDRKNEEVNKAWEKVKKLLGSKMPNYFEYNSLQDIVDKGFKGFVKKYKEYLARKPKCEEVNI